MVDTTYPKNRVFTTQRTVYEDYRWLPYKPDGVRQMKKPGRWQKRVWQGNYFRWANCKEPEGSLIEEGETK